MEQPIISVIIVSYNTKELILHCVKSLMSLTSGVKYEIIIVDNASSDGSSEIIVEQFPEIRLIQSEYNIGFARACNLGAREANGTFLLLLNPDTVVLDNVLFEFVKFESEFPKAGIWGGRTLNPDRTLNPASCWRFPSVWSIFCIVAGLTKVFPNSNFFNPEAYGGWKRDSHRVVDVVSGCLFFIRKDLWDALEGFDPIYFMYSEEVDLCKRAQKFGARPMISPAIQIVHYIGMAERIRANRLVLLLKGKITYMCRQWSPLRQWAGRFLLMLWPLSRFVFLSAWARFSDEMRTSEAALTWAQVWRSRKDWRRGYTEGHRS